MLPFTRMLQWLLDCHEVGHHCRVIFQLTSATACLEKQSTRFLREQYILQRTGFHHFLCQRASRSKAETKSVDFIKTKCYDFTQIKCSDKANFAFPKLSFGEGLVYGGVCILTFHSNWDGSKFRSWVFFPLRRTSSFHPTHSRFPFTVHGFPVCSTTFSRSLRLKLSASLLNRSTD